MMFIKGEKYNYGQKYIITLKKIKKNLKISWME